jgi:hypothetical protein
MDWTEGRERQIGTSDLCIEEVIRNAVKMVSN